MAIEDILKRIEAEAEAEAGRILAEAEGEAARIREEYGKRAERLGAALEEEARKRAGEERRRLVVSEQLELRKGTLGRKRELLDELYRAAWERIRELPEERYLALMKSLVLERAVTGREEIVVPSGQRGLFTEGFVEELNAARPGAGFTLAGEPGSFDRGVILREGRRVVDLTLPVLFEQVRDRMEPGIAAILFPED